MNIFVRELQIQYASKRKKMQLVLLIRDKFITEKSINCHLSKNDYGEIKIYGILLNLS